MAGSQGSLGVILLEKAGQKQPRGRRCLQLVVSSVDLLHGLAEAGDLTPHHMN
jgi:hypothetical protein